MSVWGCKARQEEVRPPWRDAGGLGLQVVWKEKCLFIAFVCHSSPGTCLVLRGSAAIQVITDAKG